MDEEGMVGRWGSRVLLPGWPPVGQAGTGLHGVGGDDPKPRIRLCAKHFPCIISSNPWQAGEYGQLSLLGLLKAVEQMLGFIPRVVWTLLFCLPHNRGNNNNHSYLQVQPKCLPNQISCHSLLPTRRGD